MAAATPGVNRVVPGPCVVLPRSWAALHMRLTGSVKGRASRRREIPDYLTVAMVMLLVVAVLTVGTIFFRLHTLPERMALIWMCCTPHVLRYNVRAAAIVTGLIVASACFPQNPGDTQNDKDETCRIRYGHGRHRLHWPCRDNENRKCRRLLHLYRLPQWVHRAARRASGRSARRGWRCHRASSGKSQWRCQQGRRSPLTPGGDRAALQRSEIRPLAAWAHARNVVGPSG